MRFEQVSVPEIYKTSADFRFFLRWFAAALEQIKFDTENLLDLYDPERCPTKLLWMLGDTMGYKYDDRLCPAFNRAVLLYFMSMIRNKGSKDGLVLAAEVNLKQFDIDAVAGTGYENSAGAWVEPNDMLYERLDDTSIPVNSAYVTPHVEEGYIDVVYFSSQIPVDACTEYVRPLGMYMFSSAGVRFDARTKVSVDARLTDTEAIGMSLGPTHVGHYRRDDYARLQRVRGDEVSGPIVSEALADVRHPVWYRNSKAEDIVNGDGSYESGTNKDIDPGYRALYSLQLSNNDHIVRGLLKDPETGESITPREIFSLGSGPHDVSVRYVSNYLEQEREAYKSDYKLHEGYSTGSVITKPWNLRYDKDAETDLGEDVYTLDPNRQSTIISPKPAVNPIMAAMGDAISLRDNGEETNESYSSNTPGGRPVIDQ